MAEKRITDFIQYGYPDERFQTVLSENLHCGICSDVLKDPVMCKNDHCFCRGCITEHLKNAQSCPCCNQQLNVESLTDAPRILRNSLSEARIRCDYHEQGCEEFVQLRNLASHVATCTKAPVVFANEECSSEMNTEDQTRHEGEECKFRKVNCCNCNEMGNTMQEIGAGLSDLNTNVSEQRSEMKTALTALGNRFGEIEIRLKKVENQLLNKEDHRSGSDGRREAIRKVESTRSDQATQTHLTSEVEEVQNANKRTYVVAGGFGSDEIPVDSVEVFDKTGNSWRKLQSMQKPRANANSVIYKGQVLVIGGVSDNKSNLSSIEALSKNSNPFVPPIWSDFSVNLLRLLKGHSAVLYNNNRLIVFGGYDEERRDYSDLICEVLIHFPFTTKVLAKAPSPKSISCCGFVLVDDKILIFGGGQEHASANANVTMYDITKNEFKKLAPLPYKVYDMATIKYGENVILAGGKGEWFDNRNTVISYNIETQKSVMLPPMKNQRSQCRTVADGNSIVVMGGCNKRVLKSVEAFDFRSSEWRDLPPMNEARRGFVAEIVSRWTAAEFFFNDQELKIRGDDHVRGCEKFVQLGNLASHVATCTKAPVVCTNEKCSSEINREGQARHEECRLMMQEAEAYLGSLCDQVNEQRRKLKTGLTEMGKRLGEVEFGERENRFEKVENQLKDMENKIDQLDKRFENAENQFLRMGNLSSRDERRESMLDMKPTRSDQATQADQVRDVGDEKNPLEYTCIVAGGYGEENQLLKSVAVFDKTSNSWTRYPENLQQTLIASMSKEDVLLLEDRR